MALTWEEFLNQGSMNQKKPCNCGRACGRFLEPRIEGERHQIDGREVNPDCYYEIFGQKLGDFVGKE